MCTKRAIYNTGIILLVCILFRRFRLLRLRVGLLGGNLLVVHLQVLLVLFALLLQLSGRQLLGVELDIAEHGLAIKPTIHAHFVIVSILRDQLAANGLIVAADQDPLVLHLLLRNELYNSHEF